MSLPFLSQIDPSVLSGKKVIVRIDANIPLGDDGLPDENEIYRIHAITPTLDFLRAAGASITLVSHHGGNDDTQSLAPIISYFAKQNIVLLENLRLNPGEVANDPAYAQELASYGDIYVNDAFSASHREHASIVGIPKLLPSYLGLQFEKEIKHLEPLLSETNIAVVLGGAKFSTKLDLMKKFLAKNIPIFLGGALAHAIYKACGYEIGKSFYDVSVSLDDIIENKNIIVPEYVLIENDSAQNVEKPTQEISSTHSIEKPATGLAVDDSIMDIGPSSYSQIAEFIKDKKIILWNGPLGWYEKGFVDGTIACADILASATANASAQTIIGGGDTITVLQQKNFSLEKFSFVSTGGGALLDYLIHGTLPGIKAVSNKFLNL